MSAKPSSPAVAARTDQAPARGDLPLLTVRGLHAAYRREVLAGVDLEVPAGRCLAVIGESGSGKSTLLRSLLGVGVTATGSIRLGGQELLAASACATHEPANRPVPAQGADQPAPGDDARGRRRVRGGRIGIVPQDPAASFSPVQRVGGQIMTVARTHRRQPRRVLRREASVLMTGLGLPGAAWRAYPSELSGGMAARMALVCALLPHPDLLLMDEPTAGVDGATRERLIVTIDQVRRQRGMACVIVSHDRELVCRLADDVLVLHAGRVAEYGPASQVLATPRAPITADLLAAFAALGQDAEAGAALERVTVGEPGTCGVGEMGACGEGEIGACGGREAGLPPDRVPDGSGSKPPPTSHPARPRDWEGNDDDVVARVSSLSKSWGSTRVLDGVSLSVSRGEAVALTGPSGVGKTTLARIMAGLASADEGMIQRPEQPGGVGLVFQGPAGQFNPRRRLWKSVGESLLTGVGSSHAPVTGVRLAPGGATPLLTGWRQAAGRAGRATGLTAPRAALTAAQPSQVGDARWRDLRARRARREAVRRAVEEVFTRCRLEAALLDVYPRQASLGQLQRAAIARAVLSGAELLICDEVTSALDPLAAREVLDLLAELRDNGLAILFITHDRGAAAYLCDREVQLPEC